MPPIKKKQTIIIDHTYNYPAVEDIAIKSVTDSSGSNEIHPLQPTPSTTTTPTMCSQLITHQTEDQRINKNTNIVKKG